MHCVHHINPNAVTIRQQRALSRPAWGQHLAAPRRIAHTQAASTAELSAPEPLQSQVAYAKAFMTVALRHASEAALDTAASINMLMAEQPRRMQEFQNEIQAVVEREMRGSSQRLITSRSSASSSSQGNSSSATGSSAGTAVDLEALIDELRADIAACRSLIQQIRLSEQRSN